MAFRSVPAHTRRSMGCGQDSDGNPIHAHEFCIIRRRKRKYRRENSTKHGEIPNVYNISHLGLSVVERCSRPEAYGME